MLDGTSILRGLPRRASKDRLPSRSRDGVPALVREWSGIGIEKDLQAGNYPSQQTPGNYPSQHLFTQHDWIITVYYSHQSSLQMSQRCPTSPLSTPYQYEDYIPELVPLLDLLSI